MDERQTNQATTSKPHAVVVGAGFAGLTAALTLARAGARVTVVERHGYAGGRLATVGSHEFSHGGTRWSFPAEHGLHGIWRNYRNLRRLLELHGLSSRLVPAGKQSFYLATNGDEGPMRIDIGGTMLTSRVPAPLNGLVPFMRPQVMRALLRRGAAPSPSLLGRSGHLWAFDAHNAEQIHAYDHKPSNGLIDGFPSMLREMFGTLSHNGYFSAPDQVSFSVFASGLGYYVTDDRRNATFDVFDADAGSAVIDPLCETLRAMGGRLLLNTSVESLQLDSGEGTRGVVISGPDGPQSLTADAIVLAVDRPGLRRLTVGTPLETTGDDPAHQGLPSVVLRLFFDEQPADVAGSGIVSQQFGFDNFFWLERWLRPYRAWHQATGGAVLETHLYGPHAERAAGQSDDVTAAQVRASVEQIWPALRGRCVHAAVQHNPPTHTALVLGALCRLPSVATIDPRVVRCGDGIRTPFPSFYLERTCVTGLDAARQVAPALGIDPAQLPTLIPPHRPELSARVHRRLWAGMRRLGVLPPLPEAPERDEPAAVLADHLASAPEAA